MNQPSIIFKNWVPKWLVKTILFLTILPVICMLAGYIGGIASAASYYGLDPTDIQFSIVLYYIGIASFFPLERRFFSYFASKSYFLISVLLFTGTNLILYSTSNQMIFMVFRYLGGAVTVSLISIVLNLIFAQYHSERSRVLGYALFYGTLLISNAFTYLFDAYIFQNYDFNVLYLAIIYVQIPGVLLLFFSLRREIRLHQKRVPLLKLDWSSFIIYTTILITIAYVLLYGFYYDWYESTRIWFCSAAILILIAVFIIKQRHSKRPFIDLEIYKYRNFKLGAVLLMLYYVCKGDLSVANSFFLDEMHLDSYNYAYIMFFNAVGIVIGISVAARFILLKHPMRLIWLAGFGFLLTYHIQMFFVFGSEANVRSVLLPLFFQGLGNGILMLSIVLFLITSVPESKSFSASLSGVSFRFFAFTCSLALVSFMNFRQVSVHYEVLGRTVNTLNTAATQRLQFYENTAAANGASPLKAKVMAKKMLGKAVANHTNLLFARDYYYYMGIAIIFIMLGIALLPHLHYHFRKIGSKIIPI
ncbi:MFS transporter [Flavobacterium frigidarium]|uniref:MFS transporter n=1 Tax=Flavobacterium frigidarium TaxID=99286 RepID=UPI0030D8EF15|tara:strand:- start:25334 stop:26926 length:1593 start_codon:yes stop_codon:yes gene_type:complete